MAAGRAWAGPAAALHSVFILYILDISWIYIYIYIHYTTQSHLLKKCTQCGAHDWMQNVLPPLIRVLRKNIDC